jgi:ApaG protein
MISKISGGVKITVDSSFQPEHSNPLKGEFIFAYKIFIENNNDFAVKLLRRRWFIFDSNGTMKEVEGEGVVGIQPVIEPSNSYHYVSGCNLKTELGKMQGSYLLENITNKKTFNVIIPAFVLEAPFKLN